MAFPSRTYDSRLATPPGAPSGAWGANALGVLLVASSIIVLSLGLTALGLSGQSMKSLVIGLGALILIAGLFSLELAVYGVLVAGAIDGLMKGFSPGAYGLLYKDIALWIVVLGWVLHGLSTGIRRSLRHPTIFLMILFAIYCVAEVFNCTTLQFAVGLAGLRTWVMWLPLVLVAYDLFTERAQIERFLMLVLLCTVPASLYGAYQYNRGYSHLKSLSPGFGYVDRFSSQTTVRAMSTFAHPSMFGGTMALCAILLAGGAMYTRRGGAWQIALLCGSGVSLLGMATSGGRTPFFSVIPAVLIAAALVRGARVLLVLLAIGLVVIVAAQYVIGPMHRLRYSQVTMARSYAVGRVAGPIFGGIRLALDHPFGAGVATGIGVGRGANLLRDRVEVASQTSAWTESEYARAMKELGIPGFILYVAMLVSCLKWCWFSYRGLTLPRYQAWGAALFGTIMAGLFMQCAGSALYQAPTGPIFWLSVGMLLKLSQIEASERRLAVAQDVLAARLQPEPRA